MGNQEKYSQQQSRPPIVRSLPDGNRSTKCNTCAGDFNGTLCGTCSNLTNYESYVDSPHPLAHSTPKPKSNHRNFQGSTKRKPQGNVQQYNESGSPLNQCAHVHFNVDYNTPGNLVRTYHYYDTFGRPINLRDGGEQQYVQVPNESYNTSGQPFILSNYIEGRPMATLGSYEIDDASGRALHLSDLAQQDPYSYYNTSGQPLNRADFQNMSTPNSQVVATPYDSCGRQCNMNDFAARPTGRKVIRQLPPDPYNSSGRPCNLKDFTGRSPTRQENYNSSGRPCNLQDFAGRTPTGQPYQADYNSSGRPCNLQDFADKARTAPEEYNSSGRPCNLQDFAGKARTAPEEYNSSGRPCNLQDFAGKARTAPEEYNSSGRPCNLQDFAGKARTAPEEYNSSGRPCNLQDFAGKARTAPEEYNSSGRPCNLQDFAGKARTAPEEYNSSGRPFNLQDFAGKARTAPEEYNSSGRPCNLQDFAGKARTAPEEYNSSGRPCNLQDFAGKARTAPEEYNSSGRPCNLQDFAGKARTAPEEYNSSGRPCNLQDFAGRGQTVQEDYNSSGRPCNLQDFAGEARTAPEEYNSSGRPCNLQEFAGKAPNAQEDYNSSGRPCNLQDFAGREQTAQDYNSSGQPFNLQNFMGKARTASEEYNSSGRPCNLQAFAGRGQTAQEEYNSSGRPCNLQDFAGRGQATQDYNSSGRPCNLQDFAGKARNAQVQSASYGAYGRPLNSSDFRREQTRGLQDSHNASSQTLNAAQLSQGAGQCLQVPFEQQAHSDIGQQTMFGDLSRISQNPLDSEQLEYSGNQLTGVRLDMDKRTNSAQPSGKYSTASIPSAEFQRDENQAFPRKQRGPFLQKGVSQCPNFSQQQLVQFLQNGDINEITVNEPLRNAPKSALFNILVKDNYYPGVIEDAVNGKINFNRIAFDAVFDSKNIPVELEPEEVPMSLLEAFELRIQYEKDLLMDRERLKKFCLSKQKKEAASKKKMRTTSIPDKKEEKKNDEEEPPTDEVTTNKDEAYFTIHPDELKLASTIDIDLTSIMRDHPETGLTKALACLFKAEKMNDFDKYVNLVDNVICSELPENCEMASLKSNCSFQIDMQKHETKTDKTFKPIEIISYIGTTKPDE